MNALRLTIYWFFNIIEGMLFIRCIASWFISIPLVYTIYELTERFTEPIVQPVRQLLNKIPSMATMPIDMSVLLTFILIDVIKQMLL